MAKALVKKIKKTWLKMLKAYATGHRKRGRRLENKIVQLELELKD